jgi:hypothetical protein
LACSEVKGDDIFVPEQDVYEIQTFIDGSVMTIYDAPWWIYAGFDECIVGRCDPSKRAVY